MRPPTQARSASLRHIRAAIAIALFAPILIVAGGTAPVSAAEIGLLSPQAGARIGAAFEVVVQVRPDPGEVVESVSARISGPSSDRVVSLSPDEPEPDGSQVWRGTVDPLDQVPMSNGPHAIGITADRVLAEPQEVEGHGVALSVPPPRRSLSAAPSEDRATQVELGWEPVAIPDFIAYRIQRRPHDDSDPWATVHDLADPRTDQVVDAVDEPGAYRYRLIVVRSDGDAGELFATSAPQGVRADPDDPGTFPVPPEPDPRPSATPPPPAPDPRPTDDPPDPAPAPQPAPPPPPPRDPGPVTVRPPSSGVAPPAPAPAAPPPAVVPFDDGVFEELLPFEETESEVTIIETESAFLDGSIREGGTLNVLTEDPPDRNLLVALAAGILLVVIAAHVRRFLAGGRGR